MEEEYVGLSGQQKLDREQQNAGKPLEKQSEKARMAQEEMDRKVREKEKQLRASQSSEPKDDILSGLGDLRDSN